MHVFQASAVVSIPEAQLAPLNDDAASLSLPGSVASSPAVKGSAVAASPSVLALTGAAVTTKINRAAAAAAAAAAVGSPITHPLRSPAIKPFALDG